MARLSDIASEIRDTIESRYADTGQRRFFLSNFREFGTQAEVAAALKELADAHWLDCRAKLVCPDGHRFNVVACGDISRAISNTYCDECDAIYAVDDVQAIPGYTMTEPWTRSVPQKKSRPRVTA
ncbi:MAG: hypothetical protein ACQEVA_23150 [Myxococcota bacterium]